MVFLIRPLQISSCNEGKCSFYLFEIHMYKRTQLRLVRQTELRAYLTYEAPDYTVSMSS